MKKTYGPDPKVSLVVIVGSGKSQLGCYVAPVFKCPVDDSPLVRVRHVIAIFLIKRQVGLVPFSRCKVSLVTIPTNNHIRVSTTWLPHLVQGLLIQFSSQREMKEFLKVLDCCSWVVVSRSGG